MSSLDPTPPPPPCWSAAATAPAWSPPCPIRVPQQRQHPGRRPARRAGQRAVLHAAGLGLAGFNLDREELARRHDDAGRALRPRWELTFSDVRPRVAVFVSKMPHCLYDLLLCHQLGELGGDIVTVVSNHEDPGAGGRPLRRPLQAHPGRPRRQGRAPRRRSWPCWTSCGSTWWCSPATCRSCRPSFVARWPGRDHQHPPLLPARLRRRPALPPGQGARGEGHRRHRPLRDQRAGPGADHRAGRLPGEPPRRGRGPGAQGRASWSARS